MAESKNDLAAQPTGSPETSVVDEKHAVDAKEDARLLRKIDWLLMPLLTVTFGLQFYDKFLLSSASIFGIIADLHLSTTSPAGVVSTYRYSQATSIFYFGYLAGVLPNAFLAQRLPTAKFLSAMIFLWGVIVILTPVCTNYAGLLVQRFFLGAIESAVSPGFMIITSQWYTHQEQPARLGVWYSATGLFSIFSGAVNYGLGRASDKIAPWKTMYLFGGTLTIVWALVVLVFLPDSPATAKFLTPAQKERAIARVKGNWTPVTAHRFSAKQALEAATDIRLWIHFLMAFALYVANGGVTAFGAIIVRGFGYSSLKTILMLTPAGATTAVSIYITTYLATRFKNTRVLLIVLSCLPVITGCVMIWKSDWTNRAVPLAGYYLLGIFGAPFVLLLSLSSASFAGRTKSAAAYGSLFVGYNVGNIVGANVVYAKERPVHYRSTWIAIIVGNVVTIVLALLLQVIAMRENARRDALPITPEQTKSQVSEDKDEEQDLTDKERKEFRYVY